MVPDGTSWGQQWLDIGAQVHGRMGLLTTLSKEMAAAAGSERLKRASRAYGLTMLLKALGGVRSGEAQKAEMLCLDKGTNRRGKDRASVRCHHFTLVTR